MESNKKAALFLLGAAVLWAIHGPLIVLANWSPEGTSIIRSFGGGAVVLVWLHATKQWRFDRFWRQSWIALLMGSTNYLWGLSVGYTSIVNASVLFYVNIFIGIAIEGVLKRRLPSRGEGWCAALAGLGIYVYAFFAHGIDSSELPGILMVLGSATIWAIQGNSSQRLEFNQLASSVAVGQLVFSLPLFFFTNGITPPVGASWAYLGALAILGGLPFVFWAKSVAHVKPYVGNMILMTEIPIAVLLGLMIGQFPTFQQWVGASIILTAGLLIIRVQQKPQV